MITVSPTTTGYNVTIKQRNVPTLNITLTDVEYAQLKQGMFSAWWKKAHGNLMKKYDETEETLLDFSGVGRTCSKIVKQSKLNRQK
jgi:hypothetical protein